MNIFAIWGDEKGTFAILEDEKFPLTNDINQYLIKFPYDLYFYFYRQWCIKHHNPHKRNKLYTLVQK